MVENLLAHLAPSYGTYSYIGYGTVWLHRSIVCRAEFQTTLENWRFEQNVPAIFL